MRERFNYFLRNHYHSGELEKNTVCKNNHKEISTDHKISSPWLNEARPVSGCQSVIFLTLPRTQLHSQHMYFILFGLFYTGVCFMEENLRRNKKEGW